MFMRLGGRAIGWILGSLALLSVATGVGYTRGNCPAVTDYRTDRSHYVGVVYGGPLKRLNTAIEDYKSGKIQVIVLTGNMGEIEGYKSYALKLGVPESNIVLPDYSSDTFGNVTTSSEKIREMGFPNSRRHYTSKKHVPRVHMIVDGLGEDSENDDGYVAVEDGYNNRLYVLPMRELAGCVKDRIRLD